MKRRKKIWIAYSKFGVIKYYNTVPRNCGDKHSDEMKLRCTHLQVEKNKEEKLVKMINTRFFMKKRISGTFLPLGIFQNPSFIMVYY